MSSRVVLGLALLAIVASLAPAAAAPPEGEELRRVPDADYRDPLADGPAYMAVDGEGRTWAVWSYRRGAELDIAVARSVGRTWTAPELIGTPGADDVEPRIAFTADNIPVIVWRQTVPDTDAGTIVATSLVNGLWTTAQRVGEGTAPALFVTGDRITVGFVDSTGQVCTRTYTVTGIVLPYGTGSNGPDPFPGIIKVLPRLDK